MSSEEVVSNDPTPDKLDAELDEEGVDDQATPSPKDEEVVSNDPTPDKLDAELDEEGVDDQATPSPNDDEVAPSEPPQEGTDEQVAPGPVKVADAPSDIPESVLLSRLESLIFVSPEPISVRRLARILSIPGKRVRELLSLLTAQYEDRGIVLQEVSGGFQFRSHPGNAGVIRSVFKLKPLKISRAALETLAIVAYRQPLTRAEAEEIRGVDCGGVLKYLFEKNLVRVIGRKEEPGRPIIYGTSQAFLELFGLKSLASLPALHEFHELWEEHQEIVDLEAPLEQGPDDASQQASQSEADELKEGEGEVDDVSAPMSDGEEPTDMNAEISQDADVPDQDALPDEDPFVFVSKRDETASEEDEQ
ncbi:MAG: SMC-Scp complex subunit ScpB [Myxococcota bacterium]|nr:SMC-Scp complex subunit ScpB [Myxococcota bacterium]